MIDLNEFIQDSYLKNEVEQNLIERSSKTNNLIEKETNKLINYIIKNNLGFGWKNYPYRNHKGVYITGEPFDFCIFMRKTNYYCCFDCKETIHNRWSIRKKDILQAINLRRIYETGIDAFFLILFKKEMDLRFIRITEFMKIKALRNYVEPNDCKPWKKCKLHWRD